MTDFLPDSPLMVRLYCPGCEPEADSGKELLDTLYCAAHLPLRAGSDDALVTSQQFLSGNGEVTGDDNRRWCDLFHRRHEGPSS